MIDLVFDALLALAIPVLAWLVLRRGDAARAIVLFIAFGFLLALAWARLHAPDIALVEAAVGAGLTGALLINALSWLDRTAHVEPPASRTARIVLASLCALVGLALVGVILHVTPSAGLGPAVEERLADTSVDYPVTAVLLGYRGYDTLLEIAVLVVAVLGARVHAPAFAPLADDDLSPPIRVVARTLGPVFVLVAVYLLWRGAFAPGGAFHAAAVLAGGGILFILGRALPVPRMSMRAVRLLLVVGLAWFLAVALLPVALGEPLLAYPRPYAKVLILSVEIALTISIATVLVMFFPGRVSPPGLDDAQEDW